MTTAAHYAGCGVSPSEFNLCGDNRSKLPPAEAKQEKQSFNLKVIIGMNAMSLEWGMDVVIVLESFFWNLYGLVESWPCESGPEDNKDSCGTEGACPLHVGS